MHTQKKSSVSEMFDGWDSVILFLIILVAMFATFYKVSGMENDKEIQKIFHESEVQKIFKK